MRCLGLIGLVCLVVSCHDSAPAPTPKAGLTSPFNDLRLEERQEDSFSLLFCGNLIGDPDGNQETPVESFRKHIKKIINPEDRILFLLGDSMFRSDAQGIQALRGCLKAEVALPVFNAPGNFDLGDRAAYVAHFGATWSSFDYQGYRFLLLDSELDPWNISGAQLQFLQDEIARSRKDPPHALIIMSHKPIWAGTRNTVMASLKSNAPSTLAVFNNRPSDAPTFNRDLRPKLRELAEQTSVWCFAGDVGAHESKTLHLFHESDPRQPDLHYLAVGLGNLERDAVIRMTLSNSTPPQVTAIRLQDAEVLDLKRFRSSYWMAKFFPQGLPAAALPFLED